MSCVEAGIYLNFSLTGKVERGVQAGIVAYAQLVSKAVRQIQIAPDIQHSSTASRGLPGKDC